VGGRWWVVSEELAEVDSELEAEVEAEVVKNDDAELDTELLAEVERDVEAEVLVAWIAALNVAIPAYIWSPGLSVVEYVEL
jgi:hypothetical protein